MTACVPVLGIGSPFREDQAGIRLVERLEEEGFSSGIEGVVLSFETLDRPGWGLLDLLGRVDCAILVDAMVSGRIPGTLCRLSLEDLPLRNPAVTSHAIALPSVLALGRSLGLLPDRLVLYGVEIGRGLSGASLDPCLPLDRTVRAFRAALRGELRDLFPDRPLLP